MPSAAASREIKDLLGDASQQTQRGTEDVLKAQETIQGVVRSVRSVAQLVDEIAIASSDQQRGLSEVSVAIGQIDKTTQQNAAMVERAATIAQDLKMQSLALRVTMETFTISSSMTE